MAIGKGKDKTRWEDVMADFDPENGGTKSGDSEAGGNGGGGSEASAARSSLTNDQLKAELDNLGIEYKAGDTKADLLALFPQV